MKKFICILLLIAFQFPVFAGPGTGPNTDSIPTIGKDAATGATIQSTNTGAAQTPNLQNSTAGTQRQPPPQVTPPKNDKQGDCKCYDDPKDPGWGWLLVFSPIIIFFFLFFFLLMPNLREFDFKEALAESQYPKTTVVNDLTTADGLAKLKALDPTINVASLLTTLPPTVEVSNTNAGLGPKALPSISRYMGFISTMLTLIVGLCASSFFIYHYIARGCAPDLSALSIVLIALAIGIAPYAVNKISAAASSHKED